MNAGEISNCIEFDQPGIIIHNNSSHFSPSNALLTTKGDKLCLCVSLLNGLKVTNRCKTHRDTPDCTSANYLQNKQTNKQKQKNGNK